MSSNGALLQMEGVSKRFGPVQALAGVDFEAGVANNVDVVQAQQAVATAEEDLIASAYEVDLGWAYLARALGMAEQGFRQFIRGE